MDEIAGWKQVIASADDAERNKGTAATRLDGHMVSAATVKLARDRLEQARRLGPA